MKTSALRTGVSLALVPLLIWLPCQIQIAEASASQQANSALKRPVGRVAGTARKLPPSAVVGTFGATLGATRTTRQTGSIRNRRRDLADARSRRDAGSNRLADSYAKMPMVFEENRGQTDRRVKFISRSPSHTLFLLPDEFVLRLAIRRSGGRQYPNYPGRFIGKAQKLSSQHVAGDALIRVRIVGAKRDTNVTGVEPLPGSSHYFSGSDSSRFITDIPQYGRVRYENVYPGIDIIYYGQNGRLEYDFVLSPGASPEAIKMDFEVEQIAIASSKTSTQPSPRTRSVDKKVFIDRGGNIALRTAAGIVRHTRPRIYQVVDGIRRYVPGRYTLQSGNRVGFKVDAYDSTRPLVIDPQLAYSFTFGGSASDQGVAIAVDSAGNAVIGGNVLSKNFPTVNAFQPAPGSQSALDTDAFVAKLNPLSGIVISKACHAAQPVSYRRELIATIVGVLDCFPG